MVSGPGRSSSAPPVSKAVACLGALHGLRVVTQATLGSETSRYSTAVARRRAGQNSIKDRRLSPGEGGTSIRAPFVKDPDGTVSPVDQRAGV